MCFCFGRKTETQTKPNNLCAHIQRETWLKPDRNRTETEPKQNWNRTETKPKHNHIILIDHCFVSVSVFSWKLKQKQKRNRKLLVPPVFSTERIVFKHSLQHNSTSCRFSDVWIIISELPYTKFAIQDIDSSKSLNHKNSVCCSQRL